ncbi:hypothetical protein P153DRAFT_380676 [Dothidotthia symphoricarpi CBS 119687]|uniref:Uncharacterized protein n=1 Tax=Dothidotthia symphoricarpi CBS 119687 TaxID=1392245 RepID=A0A6A6AS91_9PLEO|nr:uncharacterized protein P153DRAFT_380676 [Dothidotthia symphoricarpi CBS 119687]KAF2134862.1 hypothetical protein P153DRAFT_380676 [Dothidotthia symphoricarpi CBS 119687]
MSRRRLADIWGRVVRPRELYAPATRGVVRRRYHRAAGSNSEQPRVPKVRRKTPGKYAQELSRGEGVDTQTSDYRSRHAKTQRCGPGCSPNPTLSTKQCTSSTTLPVQRVGRMTNEGKRRRVARWNEGHVDAHIVLPWPCWLPKAKWGIGLRLMSTLFE